MKKVFIVAALFAALGFNASYADTTNESENQVETTVNQSEFTEISPDALPQTVKDAISNNYNGMTVKAAFEKNMDDAKIYKVTLTNAEDEKTSDVLFNDKGEVLPADW